MTIVANSIEEITAPIPIVPDDMTEMAINRLPERCFKTPAARNIDGIIRFPEGQKGLLERIVIGGGEMEIYGIELHLSSICHINVDFLHSGQTVTIGAQCTGLWIFHLWGECSVKIGNYVSSNGVDCFINPGGELLVGDDCMFANCFIHVGDNHALFDIETMETLNYRDRCRVALGTHVWIGARASLIADTNIGKGSAVASGSIAKGNFPPFSLIAGVPGKVKRSGVSWTRSYTGEGRDSIATTLKRL